MWVNLTIYGGPKKWTCFIRMKSYQLLKHLYFVQSTLKRRILFVKRRNLE